MGISEQTVYRWKKLYGGLGTGELRRLKQLEEENRKLKPLVTDLSLDKHILQDVLAKSSDACSATRARASGSGGAHQLRSRSITGLSSSRRHAIAGPTRPASRWTSRVPASRPTLRWSRRSPGGCGTSA